MTTIFKRTILPPHQTAAAVWCGGLLALFFFFLFPFFATAATLTEELTSLEQQASVLETEIARKKQGVVGSLSKQELLRNYQAILARIAVIGTQIPELANRVADLVASVPLPPSITIISPTSDQTIEGKAGTSFNIEWRTENWGEGALANVDLIRRADGVTVLRRTDVPNENEKISSTTVNINTNATVSKIYKVRVSAANNPSVSAESGWFVIAPLTPPDQPIILSSCGEITKSGKYELSVDIHSQNKSCLSIHDTENILLNCNNHIISSDYTYNGTLNVRNVNNFTLQSCTLRSNIGINNRPDGTSFPVLWPAFHLTNGNSIILTGNTIQGMWVNSNGDGAISTASSTNLNIHHNTFVSGGYMQSYTRNSSITNNTMSLAAGKDHELNDL